MCLEAEAKVHTVLEQSAEALAKGDSATGLPSFALVQRCSAGLQNGDAT